LLEVISSEMKSNIFLYLNVFLLSAVVLCFEIVSTRISSVIFANDYAFFILSLAILGLGSGGIYSYYRMKENKRDGSRKIISSYLISFGISLCLFIILVIELSITNPVIYFFLLFLPFFLQALFTLRYLRFMLNTVSSCTLRTLQVMQ